ncbi:uncharacterized protein LOC131682748 [Topomyia yanbarensis]|uniref:uncharacterized protein LOC131682748 n=1 Tax=Topomyia yanbarensis TaxID=2498891 RepID=UPI00273CB1AC|nr:uncharacterized protein LOC131682748 [Topomyia yanbarensis]
MSTIQRETVLMVLLLCGSALGRPGKLQEQRYEFQNFQDIASGPSAIPVMGVQVAPIRNDAVPWSIQHRNEVNAFAEMFRQNYNQMVHQHNSFMETLLRPVTYQFYQLPNGYTWNEYFGNQLEHVHQQTEQMSRQLIENLEQGKVTQQVVMQPDFFIQQAASELDKAHLQDDLASQQSLVQNSAHDNGQHENMFFLDTKQFDHNEQQHQYQLTIPVDLHEPHYQSSFIEDQQHHEVIEMEDQNSHNQYVPYIQSLPPVKFNNDKVEKAGRDLDIRSSAQFESRPISTTPEITESHGDNYYGSTYDQQPIYDLQFVENTTTTSSKVNNAIALVRKRISNPQRNSESNSTLTFLDTSNLIATTTESVTASNVMSMLPHKVPSYNYSDIYEKVRNELEKNLKQHTETTNEETHFMGMTSNTEHEKLSYDIVTNETTPMENRGDQPSVNDDDYITDEIIQSEPGIGSYPVNTEPALAVVASTQNTENLFEQTKQNVRSPHSNLFIPHETNSLYISTTEPSYKKTGEMNLYYDAPLAPLPTTTFRSNPYYSAKLAEFPTPERPLEVQQIQVHRQATELDAMVQETEALEPNHAPYVEANTLQDLNIQDNVGEHETQSIVSNVDYQQYEDVQHFQDVQQSLLQLGQETFPQQLQEASSFRQTPPEQQYRNPDVAVKGGEEGVFEPVVELTTSLPVSTEKKQKNWFQRQWSKFTI